MSVHTHRASVHQAAKWTAALLSGEVVCGSGMLRAGLVDGRRTAFLVRAWGVGVVRGAGRRGSVACGVAQRALLCFYVCIHVIFVF